MSALAEREMRGGADIRQAQEDVVCSAGMWDTGYDSDNSEHGHWRYFGALPIRTQHALHAHVTFRDAGAFHDDSGLYDSTGTHSVAAFQGQSMDGGKRQYSNDGYAYMVEAHVRMLE